MPGSDLEGHWRVRRISGLLPPGVTKQIGSTTGRTLLFGIPIGSFRIAGHRLIYRLWPIVDEVEAGPDGLFVGRGRLFGWPFCRFRLERLARG
jgi:hypothetical protein